MNTLINDIKYAIRQLYKSPGFTFVVILVLGLGVGANTAVFSVLNAVMMRPLPVKNPQQLRHVNWEGNLTPTTQWTMLSRKTLFPYQAFLDFRDHAQGVSEVFALLDNGFSLFARGRADAINGCIVSGKFFQGLGLNPLLGQTIAPGHDRRGAEPVTVISYAAWQKYFAGEPDVIGESVTLEANLFTVVGVLPQGFEGLTPGKRKDFYVPLSTLPLVRGAYAEENKDWWLSVLVRLKPEAQGSQVQASLEALYARTALNTTAQVSKKTFSIVLKDASRGLLVHQRDLIKSLHMLLGLAGIVLVMSCINLAGLLLARGVQRQHELAVRSALGAQRWVLVRQLLIESVLIVVPGAGLGLFLAAWGKIVLSRLLLPPGEILNLHSDYRVLGFTLFVTIIVVLLAGLLPAFRSTSRTSVALLKDRSALGTSSLRLGKVLVTAQISLSLILLMGAGLFARTLINLYQVEPGFDTRNLLVFKVDANGAGYHGLQRRDLYDQFSQSLRTLPGVLEVGSSTFTLLNGKKNSTEFYLPHDSQIHSTIRMGVNQTFLETMGIPLLAGRGFNTSDLGSEQKVVIINQAFVNSTFPNREPVGNIITIYEEPHRIIGVCADIRSYDIKRPPEATLFFLNPGSSYKIRTAMDPRTLIPVIRKTLAAIDPAIPMLDIKTQTKQLDESIARERCFAFLALAMALLAVLLACVGLYGVIAYNVERRTNEIGIRMALGATSMNVTWSILRSALLLAVTGIAIGIPIAFAGIRIVQSYLFGIAPQDPVTYTGTIVLLLVVTIMAALIPARRAAKVNPIEALRYE